MLPPRLDVRPRQTRRGLRRLLAHDLADLALRGERPVRDLLLFKDFALARPSL